MSETIKYSLSFQVVGGTSVPVTGEMNPEAYGKIQVSILKDEEDIEVTLPSSGIEFLLIKASEYGENLTYKVNDTTSTAITLDGPHVFIGKGAVTIVDAAPAKFYFSNKLTEDVTIDILLGRDATP